MLAPRNSHSWNAIFSELAFHECEYYRINFFVNCNSQLARIREMWLNLNSHSPNASFRELTFFIKFEYPLSSHSRNASSVELAFLECEHHWLESYNQNHPFCRKNLISIINLEISLKWIKLKWKKSKINGNLIIRFVVKSRDWWVKKGKVKLVLREIVSVVDLWRRHSNRTEKLEEEGCCLQNLSTCSCLRSTDIARTGPLVVSVPQPVSMKIVM